MKFPGAEYGLKGSRCGSKGPVGWVSLEPEDKETSLSQGEGGTSQMPYVSCSRSNG